MSVEFVENGVFVAIIGHGLIGISLLWDKVLLRRPQTMNLLSYTFWLGALSVLGLLLIPFGFHMPPLWVAALAFGAGALQLAAVYFYYAALKGGEASQTLAIMGGFSPVATWLIGLALLPRQMGGSKLSGFALMVAGGFVMFFSERLQARGVMLYIVLASGLFGLVNVMQKAAFNEVNFVTGYVFFTIGTFAGALALLARRSWRTQIFQNSGSTEPSSKFWYFVNRFMAGVGSFLIYYAISLENPAVVDAITAVRYVIIFLGAYLITQFRPKWLREDFSGMVLVGKTIATLLVVAGLVILGLEGGGTGTGGPV
jgi:uncharacterized membrane protein